MSNPSKRKGDEEERRCLAIAVGEGFNARRTRPGRMEDQGDIHIFGQFMSIPDAALQIKNVRQPRFRDWLAQLATQIKAAGAETGAIVWKHSVPGKPVERIAILPYTELLVLYRKAGYGPPPDSTCPCDGCQPLDEDVEDWAA